MIFLYYPSYFFHPSTSNTLDKNMLPDAILAN